MYIQNNCGSFGTLANHLKATGKYYNFTNIAFAQPPVGELRFAAPKSPKHIPGVQDGNDKINPTCSQAWPNWLAKAFDIPTIPVPRGPSETEDCLYLDVLVPEKIFSKRDDRSWHKAPVLVWIYGGGFVLGGKTQNGDGSGLIARSTEDPNDEGVIFVAMNYRVRVFSVPYVENELMRLLARRLWLAWWQRFPEAGRRFQRRPPRSASRSRMGTAEHPQVRW